VKGSTLAALGESVSSVERGQEADNGAGEDKEGEGKWEGVVPWI
jgi:hypothetical protein